MTNKTILTSIFNSEIYKNDNEFEIEFIEKKTGKKYYDDKDFFDNHKCSEDELENINEKKNDYYMGDFWNITSYLKDNKYGILWNIYVDKINNEVIFNYGKNIGEDSDDDIFDFDSNMENLYYDTYVELFEAVKYNKSETDNFIEVDNIEINGDGSATEDSNSNKADYVLQLLGSNGNYYGFWEYDEKIKNK